MENMSIYKSVQSVPANAQKTIQAGRLRGMTDINPMWRIQVLTEQFGPCGIGWGYTIDRQWIEDGANGERCAFCNISLWYKVNGEKSEPVCGTGGASFIAKEKNGMYTSDEAFKMALTDAISVSCKALGVGADVYWQGGRTKYNAEPPESIPPMTDKQKQMINELIKKAAEVRGETNKAVTTQLEAVLNIKMKDANAEHYAKMCKMLEQMIRPNGEKNEAQTKAS